MIIGRKSEQKFLEKVYAVQKAQFIAVYGRRRVGKTFLIREFFANKKCSLVHATGIQKGMLNAQLEKFSEALSSTFFDNAPLPLKTWSDAFKMFTTQAAKTNEKVVLFLDELPWLATRRSGLLTEIDYYWNRHWSVMPNIILIVCGSSASWLIQKILYDRGGLHNRITGQMHLLPFTLFETKSYLAHKKIHLNHEHTLDIYMALGGIPYYLEYVEAGLSAEQNVQKIIFAESAPLKNEFDKLFDSLFENAAIYKDLIRQIAKRKSGVSLKELVLESHLSSGGRLAEYLKDLVLTGFIENFIPWGQKKGAYYKLRDEFCIFYLDWLDPYQGKKVGPDFWLYETQRPAYHAWAGYAFEAVCSKHVPNILNALDIKTGAILGSWRYVGKTNAESGAQIDLVIDRNDSVINLCEIKYTQHPFVLDKAGARKLMQTIDLFKKKTGEKKQIFFTIISANGIKPTMYSEELIHNVVSLEDLFKAP